MFQIFRCMDNGQVDAKTLTRATVDEWQSAVLEGHFGAKRGKFISRSKVCAFQSVKYNLQRPRLNTQKCVLSCLATLPYPTVHANM